MSADRPRYVITVLARDRTAIIADVTGSLYELDANLDALSQTVVWGWFTMIVCASYPPGTTADQIRKAVEKSCDCTATVLPFGDDTPIAASPPAAGEPLVATVVGEDRPGIVCSLTRCLADRGINIDDVWNEVHEGRFVVIFRLTVPRSIDTKALRYELRQAAEPLGVQITLQHQDIFTATNSLSVHTPRPKGCTP